ncbi:MAG TPA: hypothetical protein VGD55_01635, partial [Acidothermaceae bacterium]
HPLSRIVHLDVEATKLGHCTSDVGRTLLFSSLRRSTGTGAALRPAPSASWTVSRASGSSSDMYVNNMSAPSAGKRERNGATNPGITTRDDGPFDLEFARTLVRLSP